MSLPKLIGITGRAGVGKDTLAAHFSRTYGYTPRAYADPLRSILNHRFGWTAEQWADRTWKESVHWANECGPFSPRDWMQWLGTEVLRQYAGWDIFVRLAFQRWDIDPYPMIMTDIRFDNEATAIHERGGVVIQLIRKGAAPVNAHVSEKGINANLIHGTLVNNGTLEQLYVAAERMISKLWEGLSTGASQRQFDFGGSPR